MSGSGVTVMTCPSQSHHRQNNILSVIPTDIGIKKKKEKKSASYSDAPTKSTNK